MAEEPGRAVTVTHGWLFSMVPETGKAPIAFEDIYTALFPVVYRIAYRITGDADRAEDISQEAFIKYMQRMKPLPDLDQTKYWLIRVVKNISLNHEKRKGRERSAYDKYRRIGPAWEKSSEEAVLREETRSSVQRALARLPYNLRIVLVLKEYSGLHYKDIGSVLGISEGNVKVRVFRAREKLAKELEIEELQGEAQR